MSLRVCVYVSVVSKVWGGGLLLLLLLLLLQGWAPVK